MICRPLQSRRVIEDQLDGRIRRFEMAMKQAKELQNSASNKFAEANELKKEILCLQKDWIRCVSGKL